MTATLAVVVPPKVIERNIDDYLDRAMASFDAGYFIEAGGLLREAVRRMMFGIFEYREVPMPRRKVKRTTGELVILLKKAGVFEEEHVAMVLDDLEVANRASHCSFVTREELRSAINTQSFFLRHYREDMPGAL